MEDNKDSSMGDIFEEEETANTTIHLRFVLILAKI